MADPNPPAPGEKQDADEELLQAQAYIRRVGCSAWGVPAWAEAGGVYEGAMGMGTCRVLHPEYRWGRAGSALA